MKQAPVHLECVYLQTVALPAGRSGKSNSIVLGRVVGVHIEDRLIVDGQVVLNQDRPVGHLGYLEYATLGEIFNLPRS